MDRELLKNRKPKHWGSRTVTIIGLSSFGCTLRPRGSCSFLRPGIGYLAGLGGSNEAKATTGSDALNSMDSVRPDGYRDRPLT
jgi:hypothetical protein